MKHHSGGFTLFYRDEEQDWLYGSVRFFWWLWLRNHAVISSTTRYIGDNNVKVHVNYGEVAVTRSLLSQKWGVKDTRTVNKFLDLLVDDGRISIREENGILVIGIVDFEQYSPPPGYFDTQKKLSDENGMHPSMQSTMRPTPQTCMHTEEKINKNNNIKKEIDYVTRNKLFFDDLIKSEGALEEMQGSLELPNGTEGVVKMLDEFLRFEIASGEDHRDTQHFRQHFMKWAVIQIGKQTTKKTKNGKTEQKGKTGAGDNGADAGRTHSGVSTGRSASDYEKTFLTKGKPGSS